jgi:hypothetical protein
MLILASHPAGVTHEEIPTRKTVGPRAEVDGHKNNVVLQSQIGAPVCELLSDYCGSRACLDAGKFAI